MLTHDSWRLPFEPASASIARTKLASFLTRNRASARTVDDALIVLSEMVANAICHGVAGPGGLLDVAWSVDDGQLLLSVQDGGTTADLEPIEFDEDSLSGRGLSIISRVADRWWVEAAGGTRVNAALALTPA